MGAVGEAVPTNSSHDADLLQEGSPGEGPLLWLPVVIFPGLRRSLLSAYWPLLHS